MYTKEQLLEAIRLAQIIHANDFNSEFTFDYTSEEIIEKITPPPPVVELEDLSEYFAGCFPSNAETIFSEWLLEEVRESTPHGRCGVDEYTNICVVDGVKYEVTISDIVWDRLDKKYYFIDIDYSPTVKWKTID